MMNQGYSAMTESEFNKAFSGDKIQAVSFKTNDGYVERAVITSRIQISTTGNKFVRLSRHYLPSVNLSDIISIKDIGEW
jgi:hypothetical protein